MSGKKFDFFGTSNFFPLELFSYFLFDHYIFFVNFDIYIIRFRKNFASKNWSTKILGLKIFGKNKFGPKIYWLKKKFGPKNFELKKI